MEQVLQPMASTGKSEKQKYSTSKVQLGSSRPDSRNAPPAPLSTPVSTQSASSTTVARFKTKKPHQEKGKKDVGHKEKLPGSDVVPPVVHTSQSPLHILPPPSEAPPEQILQVSPIEQRQTKDTDRDRRQSHIEDDLDEPYTLSSGSEKEGLAPVQPHRHRQRSPSSSPGRLSAAYTTLQKDADHEGGHRF